MDTAVLQQRLSQQRHLLPSQQELLNRLLFQLAFNDFQSIGLVGSEGSGKSTLALALAELFSEQTNVALLTSPFAEQELEQKLLQQWFGLHLKGEEPGTVVLAEQLRSLPDSAQPLLLIVDNFELLSSIAREKLLQLNCLGFFMVAKPSPDMALNLNINIPTLQDAGLILKDKALDPLAVAERFATSAGNMHLFYSATTKTEQRRNFKAINWLLPLAAVLIVLVSLLSLYLPDSNKTASQLDSPKKTQVIPAVNSQPAVKEPADISIVNPATEYTKETGDTEAGNDTIPAEMYAESLSTDLSVKDSSSGTSGLQATAELVHEIDPQNSNAAENIAADSIAGSDAVSETTVENGQAEAAYQPKSNITENLLAESNKSSDSTDKPVNYQELQLLELPGNARVIQLAVLSSEAAVRRFEQTHPETAIVVYQRSWQGQLQLVILAEDHFADIESARQARATLAAPVKSGRPFIKSVSAVQQEIKALARIRAESVAQE